VKNTESTNLFVPSARGGGRFLRRKNIMEIELNVLKELCYQWNKKNVKTPNPDGDVVKKVRVKNGVLGVQAYCTGSAACTGEWIPNTWKDPDDFIKQIDENK
jgi:hypothetical protein